MSKYVLLKCSRGPRHEYCILNILKAECEMRSPPTAAEALRICLLLKVPQETRSSSSFLSFSAFIREAPCSPPLGFY